MNQRLRISLSVTGLALVLGLASCGDDVASDLPLADEPTSTTEGSDDMPDDTADESAVTSVIGSANINGEVISGEAHSIDDIAVLESAPEQLAVTFTAGAEPCLAADAVATASDTEVVVTLTVGINDQAAFTTCEAGDFEHTITISLDESLNGRAVVAG